MIATVVCSGLPIERFDDHQLTAVAITGGETAVSSRLSRSCRCCSGSRGPRVLRCPQRQCAAGAGAKIAMSRWPRLPDRDSGQWRRDRDVPERWRHDRDSREVRAVLATMIATVVCSGLPIEPFDDHQLTAVAIMGGETAVRSRLSRSCGGAGAWRPVATVQRGRTALSGGRRWRQDRDVPERWRHDRDSREVMAVLATMIATVVCSGLPIEPFDDHQLTAVAIMGGETAVRSRLSRSWAGSRRRRHGRTAHGCRDHGRDDRQLTAVAILLAASLQTTRLCGTAGHAGHSQRRADAHGTIKISDLGVVRVARAALRAPHRQDFGSWRGWRCSPRHYSQVTGGQCC